MIEWGRDAMGKYDARGSEPGDEVSVLIWPGGHIEHWPRGTLAAEVVNAKGIVSLTSRTEPRDVRPSATAVAGGDDMYGSVLQGAALVNINNRLVPEHTVLSDGDMLILTREKVRI
ncbi:uncharacterized protein HaLaN_18900, partial [Haematococcus lacustris]